MRFVPILALSFLCLTACSGDAPADNAVEAEADDGTLRVPLRNRDGGEAGLVTLTEDRSGLMVRVEAAGLEPGLHAVHLHTIGRCDGPSFDSAGLHWNPTGKQHGRDNDQGAHLGDLANLDIGPDGRGAGTYGLPGVSLKSGERPLVDLDGAALVIHDRADDYRTDPSGASGDRIACAAFEP